MTNMQASTEKAAPVTADNFIRAETDKTFDGIVKMGSVGKFAHNRDLARSSSAATATHFISLGYSISMPERSRSRCPTRVSAS
jgi:hypothetical protein